jgi:DNA-binding transcriptional regulator YiaG
LSTMNTKDFTRVREQLGLSQAGLARELGVSRAAVSRWESGERKIDNVLAIALDCLLERKRNRGKHAKRNQ